MRGAGEGTQDPITGEKWMENRWILLRRAVGNVPVLPAALPGSATGPEHSLLRRSIIQLANLRSAGHFPGTSRFAKRYLKKSYA